VRRSSLGAITGALVLAAVVAGLAARAWMWVNIPGAPDGRHWVLEDFRDAVYYPAVAVSDGVNPYDPAAFHRYPIEKAFPLYLPATMLVHLPLAVLPYRAAELVYFLLILALSCLLALTAVVWSARRPALPSMLLASACLLASRPGHMNLLLGQVTAQTALGCYLALAYIGRRSWLAALGIALALLKPTTGGPLALLVLFGRRDHRAALAGVALAGAGSLVPVALLVRSSGPEAFVRSVLESNQAFRADRTVDAVSTWTRIDVAAFVARVAGGDPGGLIELVCLVGVLVTAVMALRRLGTTDDPERQQLGVFVTCSTILFCTYHQAYDLLLLAAPAAAIATGALGAGLGRGGRLGVGGLLAVLALNYLSTATAHDAFAMSPPVWHAIIAINPVALGACWASAIYLAFARTSGTPDASST
jgi:glycosyl transferase family 87